MARIVKLTLLYTWFVRTVGVADEALQDIPSIQKRKTCLQKVGNESHLLRLDFKSFSASCQRRVLCFRVLLLILHVKRMALDAIQAVDGYKSGP